MAKEVGSIEALLKEDRKFEPSEEFRAQANWNDPEIYARAAEDPERFWADMAGAVDWFKPWETVLEWKAPSAKWFVGGTTNVCYNCVDRHLKTWRKNKAAIIWEGEQIHARRVITYQELYREVNRCAAALKRLGVQQGDRVAIYMGMIPELAIAMLACARIGAPHTVVFGGFSPDALQDRINDSGAKVLITADGAWRRGNRVPLKENADQALKQCHTIEHVLVVNHAMDARDVDLEGYRDHWWHREMDRSGHAEMPPEELDSEHPLYILYTSGTTGKPKGCFTRPVDTWSGPTPRRSMSSISKTTIPIGVRPTSAGSPGTATSSMVRSSNGATMRHVRRRAQSSEPRANVADRRTIPGQHPLHGSDRDPFVHGLGRSVPREVRSSAHCDFWERSGEPINPEAWIWYRKKIGSGHARPIVDTWWQTETGMIMITPLPGITATKPGSATRPFPGIDAEVVDEEGNPVKIGGGYLVLNKPWPAMARTIWGDPERWKETYWNRFPGRYFTGDSAKRDEDGYFWVLGRVDDVLNVSGHRIGTMEVESALVSHPAVAEAAVIGIAHPIKGQAIAGFVVLVEDVEGSNKLIEELRNHVAEKIGPIARPESLYLTRELPKTRSGKIMRRLLRDIAEGRLLSDTTTLADADVLGQIKDMYEERGA